MIIAGGTPAKLVAYPIANGRTPGTKLTNWVTYARTGSAGDPPPSRQDWSRPPNPPNWTSTSTDSASRTSTTTDYSRPPANPFVLPTSLAHHMASHTDPADALQAYHHDRLPATSEVIRRNRQAAPSESSISSNGTPRTASPTSPT